MSDPDGKLEVKIPESALKGIVLAEVTKALGDPQEMVARWVRDLFSERVRIDYRDTTRGEHLVSAAVQAVGRELIAEIIEQEKPAIRAALKKQLGPTAVARKLVDALLTSLIDSRWNLKVDVVLRETP